MKSIGGGVAIGVPEPESDDAPTLTLDGFTAFGGVAVGAKPARELDVRRATEYLVSIPERILRAVAAALGGTIHETAELVLPRLVRKSRFYEATAKNLLRITVELVGGVEREADEVAGEVEASPKKLAVRKAGGNVVELGSILAFGFSPLWLLAAAADVTHGTRVYLDTLVSELKAAGVLAKEAEFASVDDLLAALEGASGTTARLIDIPPLEVEGLKRSLADLRDDAKGLPTPPGARCRLPRAPRGGRSRAALAPRGLGRDGPRVLQLGAQGRSPTRPRSVHGGSPAGARRGLRRRTHAAWAARTRTPSHATSTRRAERSRNAASAG